VQRSQSSHRSGSYAKTRGSKAKPRFQWIGRPGVVTRRKKTARRSAGTTMQQSLRMPLRWRTSWTPPRRVARSKPLVARLPWNGCQDDSISALAYRLVPVPFGSRECRSAVIHEASREWRIRRHRPCGRLGQPCRWVTRIFGLRMRGAVTVRTFGTVCAVPGSCERLDHGARGSQGSWSSCHLATASEQPLREDEIPRPAEARTSSDPETVPRSLARSRATPTAPSSQENDVA